MFVSNQNINKNTTVLCDVTSCSAADMYQYFTWICSHHHQVW